MSLLQDVLKSNPRALEKGLTDSSQRRGGSEEDSDEEIVNVVSLPGTPDRTRPSSPIRGASARPIRGPLHISSSRRDPLRVLPTELSQRIFARLPLKDLAKCALVSKKWSRSQTLNYVWFQHYRKENFHDESLPPGKWTKRESKQNWRVTHLKSRRERAQSESAYSRSGYTSPSLGSGYQTPREMKEEAWKQELQAAAKPGKVEMREMYKELGGRKARGKTKLGSSGVRDKGGWSEGGEW
ncbi:hypothetical protein BDQ12DRAFT_712625 [Crucibulum laeve]|uniref:F-box domain-containing protein n=1 Tax=Crucibulum laeve TaxID=68775 RepID=A0A5C3M391_9AGAR|nr:hypothetical protein BDQ12DRAFT_712625 [Crucibulum laeve]